MTTSCVNVYDFFKDCFGVLVSRGRANSPDANIRQSKDVIDKLIGQLTKKEDHIIISIHHCCTRAQQLKREKKIIALKDKVMEHRRLQTQLQKIRKLKENAISQLDLIDINEINQIFITAMRTLSPKTIIDENMRTKVDDIVQDTQDSINEVNEISNILAQPISKSNSMMLDIELTDDDIEREFESLLPVSDSELEPPDISIADPSVDIDAVSLTLPPQQISHTKATMKIRLPEMLSG